LTQEGILSSKVFPETAFTFSILFFGEEDEVSSSSEIHCEGDVTLFSSLGLIPIFLV